MAQRRKQQAALPEVSELEAVRHYTKLSQKNYSITTECYPLGSCTMKYNPWVCHTLAMNNKFLQVHPAQDSQSMQGTLQILFELQELLKTICGMHSCSLTPMAGAQGELAGMLMIKKHLQRKKQLHKNEVLVPVSAHGTNPATAVMCGFKVIEIACTSDGNIDIDDLTAKTNENTAVIMLTNPSTYGLYEVNIDRIAKLIHGVGAYLYYDGANLNALLGRIRPGDIGFDVMHTNLHKTFATPHGGGGPGSGAVLCIKELAPYLPQPTISTLVKSKKKQFVMNIDATDSDRSIGRLSHWFGNVGVLLRAYIYIRLLGREHVKEISNHAVLNSNYLFRKLIKAGFSSPFSHRYPAHECIISLSKEKKEYGVTAYDIAKNLLDYGFHAPTTYFPIDIPECLLIEPTETESKQELDRLSSAFIDIRNRIQSNDSTIKTAPNKLSIGRLNEAKAAHPKHLDVSYHKK